MNPHCDLDLEDSNNNNTKFRTTLWLMMLHHHTKFGNKMFCGSQNSFQTNIHCILNLLCDLDLEHSNPFFHWTLWPMMLYYQTKFSCKPTSSLEDTTETVLFWLSKPSLWPWPWTQWTNFSAWHSGFWYCLAIPGLVTNAQDIVWTNVHWHFEPSLWPWPWLQQSHLPQDTQAYDAVLSNQVWLQTDKQFRKYSENSNILIT